jgi:hypothetical protein
MRGVTGQGPEEELLLGSVRFSDGPEARSVPDLPREWVTGVIRASGGCIHTVLDPYRGDRIAYDLEEVLDAP